MQYIPGQCNINRREVNKRYAIGVAGLIATIIGITFVETSDLPRLVRLFMILPIGISAAGFVQALGRFCFAFGFMGYHSTDREGRVEGPDSEEVLRLDKARAVQLLAITVLTSVAATAAYYYLIP